MKLSRITVEEARFLHANDREFAKFVRENENFLRKLIHKYINKNKLNQNDSELFDDARQEALLSLWGKALLKFNGSTKFSTFAFTVIKNDLMQFLQRKTKFEKETGETLSIENLKRNYNGEGSAGLEYQESNWKIDPRKTNFESELIEKIHQDSDVKKISRIDYIILELKKRNYSREKIATAVGLNIHSYKTYYYKVFYDRCSDFINKKLEVIEEPKKIKSRKDQIIFELVKRNWRSSKIAAVLKMDISKYEKYYRENYSKKFLGSNNGGN
jgi:RNA polymerase sigma factor (sigma-70 family)